MDRFISIIGIILFDGAGYESMILGALAIAGMWLVFRKCGIPGWHALIPCYRYYELGRCAIRELEGRVMLVLQGPEILLSVLMQFPMSDMVGRLLSIIDLVLVLVTLLYRSRIYLGLFRNFGMKKGWVIVLIQCLPLLYAGIRKHPAWNAAEAEINVLKNDLFHNGENINRIRDEMALSVSGDERIREEIAAERARIEVLRLCERAHRQARRQHHHR